MNEDGTPGVAFAMPIELRGEIELTDKIASIAFDHIAFEEQIFFDSTSEAGKLHIVIQERERESRYLIRRRVVCGGRHCRV